MSYIGDPNKKLPYRKHKNIFFFNWTRTKSTYEILIFKKNYFTSTTRSEQTYKQMSQLSTKESMPSELDLDLDAEMACLYEREKLDCSCCADTQPCEEPENQIPQPPTPSIKVTVVTPPPTGKRKRYIMER